MRGWLNRARLQRPVRPHRRIGKVWFRTVPERSSPLVQGNMARDKLQTQLQIKSALKERSARVACLIAESMRDVLDLLDEQPPDVIEAMLEGAKEAERAGGLPKQRTALRAAILKYMEDHAERSARPTAPLQGIILQG
jgi:hypothetical protein